jgi:hypothetical protein
VDDRRHADNDGFMKILTKFVLSTAHGMTHISAKTTPSIKVVPPSQVYKETQCRYFQYAKPISSTQTLVAHVKEETICDQPFQIAAAVYGYSKLRLYEFYYNFVKQYLDRALFEPLLFQTDCVILAFRGTSLTECEVPSSAWLDVSTQTRRIPGLFHLDCEGERFKAVGSNCYEITSKCSKPKIRSPVMLNNHGETFQNRKRALNEDGITTCPMSNE